jgi:PAS domain S-box-containing protein
MILAAALICLGLALSSWYGFERERVTMAQREGLTALSGMLVKDVSLNLALRKSLSAVHGPLHQQAAAFFAVYATLIVISAGALAWLQGRRRRFQEIEIARSRELAQAIALSAGFRTLIEEAPVAVAVSRHGHFIYTNRRYNLLHGYEAQEDLTGLPWRAMIAASSADLLQEQLHNLHSDAPVEQRFEAVALGKNATPIAVFKSSTSVQLSDGAATLIFVQDISAQKSAEQNVLEARDAAQAANRAKAEFLANMSHEIRTPLNAILGFSYLLERGEHDDDTRATLGKIRGAGGSLLGIVNDILDVSKIEAGAMVLEHAWFSLQDTVDAIAESISVAVADKPIAVLIRPLPDGVGKVLGDAFRLEQLLLNLTDNAIKFTHQGRIELSIRLRSRADGQADLLFEVSDSGIGIAAEQQSSIFAPFMQADSSTTRRFGGSGLGLAICKQIVDLMGGQIGVHSIPGNGSTFWFALPLQVRPAAEKNLSPDMLGLQVLFAPSGSQSQCAIEDTAGSFGWQTLCFESPPALLEHLRHRHAQHRSGVVVIDWQPAHKDGKDGIDAVRAVRNGLPADACPVVLLASAYRAAAFESTAERSLVDAVLVKPVTTTTMYKAVIEARRRRVGEDRPVPGMAARQPRAMLSGLRILVVDDSDLNRDVAARILVREGASVVLADNGRAAVDRMLAQPANGDGAIDLILMDVQMPVMDGIEATRILRSMARFADLPIVGLSASAFSAQQEAAHSAGMTQFVAKPFDVPATVDLIRQLAGRRAAPAGAGAIDMVQAENLWDDRARHQRYLAKFLAGFQQAAAAIRAHAESGNTAAAAALAHKLAGAAANLALPAVYAAGQRLERALRHSDDHHAALDAMEKSVQQARGAARMVQAPAEQAPACPGVPASRATVAPLIEALERAAQEGRPAPAEKLLDKLAPLLPAALLQPIQNSIDNFDFSDAALLARALSTHLQFITEQ